MINVLAFTPVGKKFTSRKVPFLRRHVLQGLCTLECIHSTGLVVRDPRPANLLCVGDDLMLIDLGTAVDMDKRLPFEGSVRFASNAVLSALCRAGRRGASVTYTFRDDLHAFVRACAALSSPWLYQHLLSCFRKSDDDLLTSESDLALLARFWDEHLGLSKASPPTLWTALDHAIDGLTTPGTGYDALYSHVLLMDRALLGESHVLLMDWALLGELAGTMRGSETALSRFRGLWSAYSDPV